MESCAANAGSGFIGSVTSYFDCQALNLGSGAWAALNLPGSSLTLLLTGLLTIFIALIGYRLLLGGDFTLREITLSFVKLGAVFALATSWPAYRTLAYDLVTIGPAQLVNEIGPRAGVAGSDGTLVQRLDAADRSLVQLAILGVGPIPPNQYREVAPPPFIGFDNFALGGSRILYLSTAIAALSAVRLVVGFMLALGPFFIAFLLFDGTRSLFEGWIRVIAGAAIASVGVSLVLGLQLGLMEPWLVTMIARRSAGESLPTMSTELFVMTGIGFVLVAAILYACFALTGAFRLAPIVRAATSGFPPRGEQRAGRTLTLRTPAADPGERSRAAAVAAILGAAGRREELSMGTLQSGRWLNDRPSPPNSGPSAEGGRTLPLGRSFNRRYGNRVSAIAAKRDVSE